MNLFTIGYEGMNPSRFLGLLIAYGIEFLIDVRDLPLSRKKGFSKEPLRDLTSNVKIQYIHMKPLGCPKPIRHQYKIDKDWNSYSEKYLKYLDSQITEMHKLYEFVKENRCALLCFEANAQECHRSLIAWRLTQRWDSQIKPIHISAFNTRASSRISPIDEGVIKHL